MSPETDPETDLVGKTIEERSKIYGDPHASHANLGLIWTGLLQQHYGLTLPHPIPAEVAELMMVALKLNRSMRVYHADNFVDAAAFLRFAEGSQKPKGTG